MNRHPANTMTPIEYLSHVLGLPSSRIESYFRYMSDYASRVDQGREFPLRGDVYPDHTYAGRVTGILNSGQLQIRLRLREWAEINSSVLFEVYNDLLRR